MAPTCGYVDFKARNLKLFLGALAGATLLSYLAQRSTTHSLFVDCAEGMRGHMPAK